MAKPRIYESQMKSLKVRALHNTREIAFLVQWDDPTADDSIDVNKFTDAVALEFPASSAAVKPHFSMGDKENSVNIWFWKANWQKVSTPEKIYATVDDFNSGVLAGNPVSKPRPSLVENIIAKGFGSATDREKAENQRVVCPLDAITGALTTSGHPRVLLEQAVDLTPAASADLPRRRLDAADPCCR